MKMLNKQCMLIIALWFFLPLSIAEELQNRPTAQDASVMKVPLSLLNPRVTMQTFSEAMQAVSKGDKKQLDKAISTLDLSNIASVIEKEKGKELAHSLYLVIERSKQVILTDIPEVPRTEEYVFGTYSQGTVKITKQIDGRWLFSKDSLSAVPDILEGLLKVSGNNGTINQQVKLPVHIKISSQLPEALKGSFLLKYWQWLGVFIVILIGSVTDRVVAWFLAKNVSRWQKSNPVFKEMDNQVLRPLGLMAMALIWWSLLGMLGLPDTALIILSVAVKILVCLSAIWSTFRLVDIVDALLKRKALATPNKFDDLLVPMVRKSLKVFVVVMGVVFSADNLNIDVTSLLTGLGLGGLAFALAAKDLLGNFFGSLTVLLDRPFQIGDWVVIGDVEGSVEGVGFRSTKVRTFYNSLITVPNSFLTNTKIDNMGARRFRRMKSTLGLTYDTAPEKIDAFCEGIRGLIQLHPYMRKDYYHVYFNEYNAASLDILVYVFWETPDWNMELRERHRFLLDILRLAKQLSVEFAYPTQTLYLKQNEESSPSAGAFSPSMTEKDAFALGQKEARSIVEATMGLNAKPGRVNFPQ